MRVRVGFETIKAFARVIAGDAIPGRDAPVSPYRTHAALDEFFAEDLKLKVPPTVEGEGRAHKTEIWLKTFNDDVEMKTILEAAVRRPLFIGTKFTAERAVAYLNEYLSHDSLSLVASGKTFVLRATHGVELPTTPAADVLSDVYVREQVEKCDAKLAQGDLDGAITNARTLLEAILGELELRLLGRKNDYKGELPRQYKAVSKALRLDDERPELDDRFKDVVRGLVQTVNGLASLQNKISDRHARTRSPAPHHARVVVNAAKTITIFLVESYTYQTASGALKASSTPMVAP